MIKLLYQMFLKGYVIKAEDLVTPISKYKPTDCYLWSCGNWVVFLDGDLRRFLKRYKT